MTDHVTIEFASQAGELLLRYGAETSRVEDTIMRICTKAGFTDAQVLAFPTGILIDGTYRGLRLTRVRRIHSRDTNMTVISQVNDISRRYADGKVTLEEGIAGIRRISSDAATVRESPWILFAGALASATATILLGGSWSDFIPAIVATALVRVLIGATAFNLAYILQLYLAGLFAGLISSLFADFSFGEHLDKIIVGALLPLVPGVALTNAVRDFISGDLLSGTLRTVEALLVAAALAGGVGFALALYAGYLKALLLSPSL